MEVYSLQMNKKNRSKGWIEKSAVFDYQSVWSNSDGASKHQTYEFVIV